MSSHLTKCDNVTSAMNKINTLIQETKSQGQNVLKTEVGEHLNPGDVYDAYQSIPHKPVTAGILKQNQCGPFVAVYLHRFPEQDPSLWEDYVKETFNPFYTAGFRQGFQLMVPDSFSDENIPFLRGIYDGIMAHAAIF